MQAYLIDFFEKFSYPTEARDAFLLAYRQIMASHNAAPRFMALLESYDKDKDIDYDAARKEMIELSLKAGVLSFTGEQLLFTCFSRRLRERYREAGIADEIWYCSMLDLKYKVEECRLMYGVWGTFVAFWYKGFFNMTRFGFGRLQVETKKFGKAYQSKGVQLTPDSIVLGIHIPRSGEPMTKERIHEAYRMAAAFFKPQLGDAPIVFHASTWLFFDKHEEMLKPTSNIYQLMKEYDIYERGNYADYTEVWRLFDRFYAGDPNEMPADSSLRRAYIELMKRGEPTGWGKGVLVWDPGEQ